MKARHLVAALLPVVAGCSKLAALWKPYDRRHYIDAALGAGMTGLTSARDVSPDAEVRYHYAHKVALRLGAQVRSTFDVIEGGADAEVYPLLLPVNVFVGVGASHLYDGGTALYLEGGLRFELKTWPDEWMPNDYSSVKRIGLAASYSGRFSGYADTLWLSFWFGYGPATSDD